MTKWPIVLSDDDGIRPFGEPDRCFYCHQKIGEPHGRGCVTIVKRIKVRYTVEIEIDVPHSWDEAAILFLRNESSWCANNAVADIEAFAAERGRCLCDVFTCEIVGVVDDTPRQ